MFKTLAFLVYAAFAYNGKGGTGAQTFEVSGELHCTFYRHDGSVFTEQFLPFEMLVSGPKWRLRNFERSEGYWERTCDGTNIYCVFIDRRISHHYAGYIEPGTLPSGGYPAVLPWFAFAFSNHYPESMHVHAPWLDARLEPNYDAFTSAIDCYPKEPFLPRSATWTVGSLQQADSTGAQGEWLRGWHSRLPTNFVGGAYSVDGWSELGAVSIPSGFRLVTFSTSTLDPRTGRTNCPVAAVYSLTNAQLRIPSYGDLRPMPANRPIDVADMRFRDVSLRIAKIQYTVTNQWILCTNDPHLQKLYEMKRRNAPRGIIASISGDWRRASIYVLLGCAFCVPVVLIVRGWKMGGSTGFPSCVSLALRGLPSRRAS